MFDNYVNIKGQKLTKYSFNIGGGMTGGFYEEKVSCIDEKNAVIRIRKSEFHNEEPEVSEYTVDVAIMDELEAVIRKHKMNHWHRKKFTNMFVCDGESEGYSFDFEKSYINFSSQIYPAMYSSKLKELRAVVKKYINKSEEQTE